MIFTKIIDFLLAPINLYGLSILWVITLLLRSKSRLAIFILCVTTLSFFSLSLPRTASYLLQTLAISEQKELKSHQAVDAIIVLGGGQSYNNPHFGAGLYRPSAFALERLIQATRLQRRLGVPLVLSGGKVLGEVESEAVGMHRLLVDLGVKPSQLRVEGNSRNTCENAINALNLLAQEPEIKHIAIVTHRWHMPRALWCFERYAQSDFIIKAVSVNVSGIRTDQHLSFFPNPVALLTSSAAIREHIGMLWYKIRY